MLCSSTITSGERAGRDILATIMEIIHAHLACLPCFAAPPPSPPLSPMEGELETLLGGPSDHSLKLTGRLRRANPSATAENALEYDVGTSFELERDGEVGAAQGIGDVRRTGDGDPKEVDEAALRRFMSRLEPGLSMQEIEREEQEETARQERGRASRREAGLTDLAVGNAAAGDGKDEFGTFQSAARRIMQEKLRAVSPSQTYPALSIPCVMDFTRTCASASHMYPNATDALPHGNAFSHIHEER